MERATLTVGEHRSGWWVRVGSAGLVRPWLTAVVVVLGSGCGARTHTFDAISIATARHRGLDHDALVRRSAEAIAVIETDVGRGMAFVIDPRGYLITNRHVIEDAAYIARIRFPAFDPPRTFERARVVYSDPERDLALLYVAADAPLPRLPLATRSMSRAPRARPWIEADDPVTVFERADDPVTGLVARGGMVSALAVVNEEAGPGTFVGFSIDIQRGQSGGPLLDRHGRAVGVVTWAWKEKTGGYAIPIDDATRMLAERPHLERAAEHRSRAEARSREFLDALGRGDVEQARRLTSPSYARRVREASVRQIMATLEHGGMQAMGSVLASLDALAGELEEDGGRVHREQLGHIVKQASSPAFREQLGLDDALETGQLVSFFFELGHAYLMARAEGKGSRDALLSAMRRLKTIDAARTFALAEALARLGGREIEIRAVDVVPGDLPSVVVSLRTKTSPVPGRGAPPEPTTVKLHMKLEWGDWYVAEVGGAGLADDPGVPG